jgi:phage FluMu protein Com
MTMSSLDGAALEVHCPRCRFANSIVYRQARLRDVIICRGCKANIRLDDHMNECRNARQQMNRAVAELKQALASVSRNITFRI